MVPNIITTITISQLRLGGQRLDPGERVVYSPPEQPDDSLASIARDLDGE